MSVARARQLERCVPCWKNYKTVLYIGARLERMQIVDSLVAWDYEIDVLEAYPPNAAELIKWNAKEHWFRRIITGDVRDINQLPVEPEYDVVMFWHGPEHIDEVALPNLLRTLEGYAGRLIILACPWGIYAQGAAYGNPFEAHISALYPPVFKMLGYDTDTIGSRDRRGSNLIAWKKR